MHGRPAAPRAVAEDDGVVLLGRSGAAHPASHVAVVVFEPSVARITAAIAIAVVTTTGATAAVVAATTVAVTAAAAASATTATTNFIASNAVVAPAASTAVGAATVYTAAAMAVPGCTIFFLIPRRRALMTLPRARTSPLPRVTEAALGPPGRDRFEFGRGSTGGVGASKTFRPDCGTPN